MWKVRPLPIDKTNELTRMECKTLRCSYCLFSTDGSCLWSILERYLQPNWWES